MFHFFTRNKKTRFESLYQDYSEQLYLLIIRYVVSQFDAEEVLQRGFVKVYQKIDQFDYRSKKETKAWLNQIMVNESLLFLREQKRLHLKANDTDINLILQPEIEDKMAYEACISMIRNLPDGYRTVFNLYVLEGYSHKEIAEQLSISESASRSQLSRARKILQKQLKSMDYEAERVG